MEKITKWAYQQTKTYRNRITIAAEANEKFSRLVKCTITKWAEVESNKAKWANK
jgi:hypothetical protein